ncbi:hypothetical protein E4U54_003509 [Claviceps lovelessii]|nr:hypothetical protein E4U54_003509 [Claviceps lovelessii]
MAAIMVLVDLDSSNLGRRSRLSLPRLTLELGLSTHDPPLTCRGAVEKSLLFDDFRLRFDR